jgi:hypothetical protein
VQCLCGGVLVSLCIGGVLIVRVSEIETGPGPEIGLELVVLVVPFVEAVGVVTWKTERVAYSEIWVLEYRAFFGRLHMHYKAQHPWMKFSMKWPE